jgi:hypothetical protein
MTRAFLPFYCFPTPAAAKLIGSDVDRVALLALRAMLLHAGTVEVAHQQVRYAGHDLAFSSRVNKAGDLVIDLDIGDQSLRDRIVLEAELRRETCRVKGIRDEARRHSRR